MEEERQRISSPAEYQAGDFVSRVTEYLEEVEVLVPDVFRRHSSAKELVFALFSRLFPNAGVVIIGECIGARGERKLTIVERYPKRLQRKWWDTSECLKEGESVTPGKEYYSATRGDKPQDQVPYISNFGNLIEEFKSLSDKGLVVFVFRPPFCEPDFDCLSALVFWKPSPEAGDVRNYPGTWDQDLMRLIFLPARIALLYGAYENWELAYDLGGADVLFAEGRKLLDMCKGFPEVVPPFRVFYNHFEYLIADVWTRKDEHSRELLKESIERYGDWSTMYKGGSKKEANSIMNRARKLTTP